MKLISRAISGCFSLVIVLVILLAAGGIFVAGGISELQEVEHVVFTVEELQRDVRHRGVQEPHITYRVDTNLGPFTIFQDEGSDEIFYYMEKGTTYEAEVKGLRISELIVPRILSIGHPGELNP